MANNSSNKEKQEEADKLEQAKKILRECPGISDHGLEFLLSLPVEERRPKVTDLPPIIATEEALADRNKKKKWQR